MNFLLDIAVGYIAIVYGLIPLIGLIVAILMVIIGLIARCYYAIEDFFTGAKNEE